MTNKAQSLTRGGVHLLASTFGTSLLGVASGIALARGLGVHYRGIYQYVTLFYLLAPAVMTFSVATVISAIPPGSPVPTKGYTAFLAVLCLIGSVLALVLHHASVPWLPILILVCLSPFYFGSDVVQGLATHNGQFSSVARYRWIDVGGSSAVMVVLYLVGWLNIATATAGLIVPTAIAVCVTRYAVGKSPRAVPMVSVWDRVRAVHARKLMSLVAEWFDQLTAAVILSASGLATYAVATAMSRLIGVFPSALMTVVYEGARRDASDKGGRVARVLRLVLWIGVVSVPIIAVTGPPFFGALFGSEYRSAGLIAAALVAGATCDGLLILAEAALTSNGLERVAARARAKALPLTLLSVAIPILFRDAYACAVMSFVASFGPLTLCLVALKRHDICAPGAVFALPGSADFVWVRNRLKRWSRPAATASVVDV